ncbi:MAG: TetR/AcrR family transcriptional regulator [Cystobacter sp.]
MRGVLDATIEQLVAVGYAALRVEDVAARAGVNKTTIYRRWPTKPELVTAALRSITFERLVIPDTGTLRGDLLEVGRHMATAMGSKEGRAFRRIVFAEELNPEFHVISLLMRDSMETCPQPVFDAARARGELISGAELTLLFSSLAGTIQHRLFMEQREVDDGFLHRMVDMYLLGVLAPVRRK